MGTVYNRGDKHYLGFKDVAGKWRYKSSGFAVGQEKQAQELCCRPAYVIGARFGRPVRSGSADVIRSGSADLIRVF